MVVPTLLYTHFFFLLCFLYLFALLPPRNTPLYTDITLLHFRVPKEYDVIILDVFNAFLKLRTCVLRALLISPFETFIPVAGIRLRNLYGKQLSAGFLLNPGCQLCHMTRCNDAWGRHRIYFTLNEGIVCPRKICHQNIATVRRCSLPGLCISGVRISRFLLT